MIETRSDVPMDEAHAYLIGALVRAHKPLRILELGLGSGLVTRHIQDAAAFNGPESTNHLVVDSWFDWAGKPPDGLDQFPNVTFMTMTERDFVEKHGDWRFDLIVSDADHSHAHEWSDKVWEMLKPRGIIVYHDVCGGYPGLYHMANRYVADRSGVIFNWNSRSSERCERGLLVVFKPC